MASVQDMEDRIKKMMDKLAEDKAIRSLDERVSKGKISEPKSLRVANAVLQYEKALLKSKAKARVKKKRSSKYFYRKAKRMEKYPGPPGHTEKDPHG